MKNESPKQLPKKALRKTDVSGAWRLINDKLN